MQTRLDVPRPGIPVKTRTSSNSAGTRKISDPAGKSCSGVFCSIRISWRRGPTPTKPQKPPNRSAGRRAPISVPSSPTGGGSGIRSGVEGGLDYFGRSGARAVDAYTGRSTPRARDHGSPGRALVSAAAGGRTWGCFLSADYAGVRRLDLLAGVRWDGLPSPGWMPSPSEPARPRATGWGCHRVFWPPPAGFYGRAPGIHQRRAGVPAPQPQQAGSIRASAAGGSSSASRGLRPETSLNLDGGLKLLGKRPFRGPLRFPL